MIILYNESDRPYENRTIDSKGSGSLNKVIKKRKSHSRGQEIVRQCFIFLADDNLLGMDLSPFVEMDAPLILSKEPHKVVFGNKDLNPIGWTVDEEMTGKKKNIFILTLRNGINTYFQTEESEDTYVLEYSVSRGELSIVLSCVDNGEPFRFSMVDVDNRSILHYTIQLSKNQTIQFNRRKEYVERAPDVRPLKKFRPAIATEYILTEDQDQVFRDKSLRLNLHTIMEVNDENIEEVIQHIRDRSVKAVTFYGAETKENERIRELLERNFRIFYVMNAFRVARRKVG